MDAVADFTRWGSQPCRSRFWDFVSLVCFVVSTAFVRFIQDLLDDRFAGCLISNYHVVKDAAKVRLLTGTGLIDATVVKVDAANDLALLKAAGKFAPLPIAASRTVKLGGTVATVGFPIQDFMRKPGNQENRNKNSFMVSWIPYLLSAGPRYFQISLIQETSFRHERLKLQK